MLMRAVIQCLSDSACGEFLPCDDHQVNASYFEFLINEIKMHLVKAFMGKPADTTELTRTLLFFLA